MRRYMQNFGQHFFISSKRPAVGRVQFPLEETSPAHILISSMQPQKMCATVFLFKAPYCVVVMKVLRNENTLQEQTEELSDATSKTIQQTVVSCAVDKKFLLSLPAFSLSDLIISFLPFLRSTLVTLTVQWVEREESTVRGVWREGLVPSACRGCPFLPMFQLRADLFQGHSFSAENKKISFVQRPQFAVTSWKLKVKGAI